MTRRLFLTVLAASALLACGCRQKVSIDRAFNDMTPGDIKAEQIPALDRDYELEIFFKCSPSAVTVAVFAQSDANDLLALDLAKALDKRSGNMGEFAVALKNGQAASVVVLEAKGSTAVALRASSR